MVSPTWRVCCQRSSSSVPHRISTIRKLTSRKFLTGLPMSKTSPDILSLSDTAALLSECVALISNDSGMMHLAVALGIPAFGIFGITSPLRESMLADNMFPITKGLPCELGCHHGTWGRRDCQHHLLCLKSLTAPEVLREVRSKISLVSVDSLSLAARC